ncbi:unnamed protein product [Prunus armeniaca]
MLDFPAYNNKAEYEALLAGLRLAKELSIKKLAIYLDSQLITSQALGEYMAKHPRMILYLDKVQEMLKAFPTFTIQQVPRAENAHVDALASLGSSLDTQFRRSIPVEHLDQPSIEEAEQLGLISLASSTRKRSRFSAKYTTANVEITLGADRLLKRLSASAISGLPCTKTPWSMVKDVIDANATSRSLAWQLRNTIPRIVHGYSCSGPLTWWDLCQRHLPIRR